MRSSDGGKGDSPRPVDQKKFDTNFDNIFRKKEPECPCHDAAQQFIDKWHLHDKLDNEETECK